MRRQLYTALVTAITLASVALGHGVAEAGGLPGGPHVADYQHPGGAAINWTDVHKAGASFGIVKATEGTFYRNPYWSTDWSGIHTAGMVRGTYEFARPALPISSAVSQADYLESVVGNTRQTGDLPPILDLEVTGGLTPPELITWTQTWVDTIRHLTGRAPIVYSYPYFWETAMDDTNAFTAYPLWIADYNGGSAPTMPLPGAWPNWTLWQFTSSDQVKGIEGYVDASRFDGTTSQLAGLANGTSPNWALKAPSAPVRVAARAGADAATVYWEPAFDGGSPVTSYKVTAEPGGRTATVGGVYTAASIGGLSPTTTYTFTVTATNAVGTSASSARSNPVLPSLPTQLTGGPSPTTVVPGHSSTESVQLRTTGGSAISGQTVTFHVRPHTSSTWSQAGSVVTNASGVASLSLAPTGSEDVYATFATGGGYLGSQSSTQTLWVVPSVAVTPSASSVDIGGPVSVTGTVTPATPGTKLALQDYASGRWETIGEATVNSEGGYSTTVYLSRPGANVLRVYFPGTVAYGVNTSRWFTVSVVAPMAATRGLDNRLYVWLPANWTGTWKASSWANLGGDLFATPAMVNSGGTRFYFAVGPYNRVYVRTGFYGWHYFGPAGTTCRTVSAASYGSQIWVACQTTSYNLAVAQATVSNLMPVATTWTPLGGAVMSTPGVAVVGGTPEFAVLGPTMDGHNLWERTPSTGWQLQSLHCDSPPALAASGSTQYLACAGSSTGDLLFWTRSGTTWSAPTNLSGVFSGVAGLVATPAGPVFYVIGPTRALYVKTMHSAWVWLSGYVAPGTSAAP